MRNEALRDSLRQRIRPIRRGWYRAGYTRALEDVAAVLRHVLVGVTAAELADILDQQASSVRQHGEPC